MNGEIIDWNNCHTPEQLDSISTTKNNLAQERYQDLIEYFGDEKVAKTILESRKEFKAWLERLRWNVKRADELARELEQIKSTAKNDLGVDAVRRKAVLNTLDNMDSALDDEDRTVETYKELLKECYKVLPSATPIRPKGHWISHEEHCRNLGVTPSGLGAYEWCSNCDCGIDVREWHRNNYNYCPNCGSYNGGASNGNE